jgi:hypothetical protein
MNAEENRINPPKLTVSAQRSPGQTHAQKVIVGVLAQPKWRLVKVLMGSFLESANDAVNSLSAGYAKRQTRSEKITRIPELTKAWSRKVR